MLTGLLYFIGIVCVVWALAAAVMIAAYLDRRGSKVSFLWLRLLILKYLHEYASLTREETGHVGPLFYHYVVPLNTALVVFVLVFIIDVL